MRIDPLSYALGAKSAGPSLTPTSLTVTENGFGKITDVEAYSKHHRGGQGVITIICSERNGNVLSVRKVAPGDHLMLTSMSGKVLRIETDAIRETGRNAQGVKLMDMRDDDKVVAVQPIMAEPADDEVEAITEAFSEVGAVEPEGDPEAAGERPE